MSKMPEVSCKYGAPMGRPAGSAAVFEGPVTVFKVVLNNGGYDSGGAYWGAPDNLYCATDNEGFCTYIRAKSRMDIVKVLKEAFPNIVIADEPDYYAFVRGYLECAAWSGIDEDDHNLKGADISDFDADDFTAAEVRRAEKDCREFMDANRKDLQGLDESQCGHDYWLTRNHHGAGFWDRGYGAVGERLTKAAHSMGSTYVYLSRRKKLHIEGG